MANPLSVWRGQWTNPFREVARMQSALDKMLEELPEFAPKMNGNFKFSPSCEVTEGDKTYSFKFDLPGVPKDQVKVELVENQLTVSAERKEEKQKDSKNTHLSEINYGSYTRTFTLPTRVDDKKVDAKFENGVLTVTVPKIESNKAKQIAIQ